MYYKENDEHTLLQFDNKEKILESEEVKIYTWKDATLRELADLVKEMVPAAKKKDATIEFYIVYLNFYGKYKKRLAGSVSSIGKGKEDYSTLEEINMRIGDLMDVKIKYPQS